MQWSSSASGYCPRPRVYDEDVVYGIYVPIRAYGPTKTNIPNRLLYNIIFQTRNMCSVVKKKKKKQKKKIGIYTC